MAAQESASAAKTAIAPYDLWSKLPGDLLAVIYGKIGSPLDRVRFGAVSRSWCAVTSWQPAAPTFPWLILGSYQDGTAERVYCPVEGALIRIPLSSVAIGKRLVGFHDGGWIAATSAVNGNNSLVIVNIFSGIEVSTSAKQGTTPTIFKVVFSEAPTSNRCILAAIIPRALAVCRVGCRKSECEWWRSNEYAYGFQDIALCDGKLYGLNLDTIYIFHIQMTEKGSPVITTTYEVDVKIVLNLAREEFRFGYIVSHDNKLFVALRARWSLESEHFFKVFEVVNINNAPNEYKCVQVITLGNHALFLGATCSTVVHLPAGRRGAVEENHIYYNYIGLPGVRDSICECDDPPLARCDNGDNLYGRKKSKVQ